MRIFKLVPFVLAALPLALTGKKQFLQVNGAINHTTDDAGPGSCSPISPTTRRCDGNKLQWCKYTGWETFKECSKDEDCITGTDVTMGSECRARAPPINDLPIEDRPIDDFPIDDFPIDDGREHCNVNAQRCHDNKVQVCALRKQWADKQICTTGQVCEENCGRGNCKPYCRTLAIDDGSERCPANAWRCHDNKIQDCTHREHWADRSSCASGEVCTENCSRSGCNPYCRNKSLPSALYPECKPGLQKCDVTFRRLLVCNKDRNWDTDTICDATSDCVNDSTGKAHCKKQKKGYAPPPASRSDSTWIDSCWTENEERCTYNPDRTQKCTRDPFNDPSLTGGLLVWKDTITCPENSFCYVHTYPSAVGSKTARCMTGKKMAQDIPVYDIPKLCTPGEQSCSEDAYRRLVCNSEGTWETAKKCTTPGDCKIDGLGHAHCERGGIDPPKPKRTKVDTTLVPLPKPTPQVGFTECHPGDRACDSERRFKFICSANGMWSKPLQCYGPGWCKQDSWGALVCDGFPLYEGDKPGCNGQCEAMDYLYCIGAGDDKPEVVKKCFDGMCAKEICKGCDRCNYHIPYGVTIVPDRTTLVKGPDNNE